MKILKRFSVLLILAVSLFMSLSCSKDDDGPSAPPPPNFEDQYISDYVWNYNHVLWFDLDYDAKLGNTSAYITLSAKDPDLNDDSDFEVSLKVNNALVAIGLVESYRQGKIYYSNSPIDLSTNQVVSYEITRNGVVSSGTIPVRELPDEVLGTFPDFDEDFIYANSWTYASQSEANFVNPSMHVVECQAGGSNNQWNYRRQFDGMKRSHTLESSMWSDIAPIDYFSIRVSAILYKLKNSNTVLTVGVSNDYYSWGSGKKGHNVTSPKGITNIMDLIHQDINK